MTPYEAVKLERFGSLRDLQRELTNPVPAALPTPEQVAAQRQREVYAAALWAEYEERRQKQRAVERRLARSRQRQQEKAEDARIRAEVEQARRQIRAQRRTA